MVLTVRSTTFSVWQQSRGFKTLKSRTRRLQGFDRSAEPEGFTPSFVKVCLLLCTVEN